MGATYSSRIHVDPTNRDEVSRNGGDIMSRRIGDSLDLDTAQRMLQENSHDVILLHTLFFQILSNAPQSTVLDIINSASILVDVNYSNSNGVTAVAIASFYGNESAVKLLHSKGANINKADINGSTPLHCACYNGHFGIAQYLWNQDAEVNLNLKDNVGRTPLYLAALTKEFAALDLFLNNEIGDSVKVRCHDRILIRPLDKGLTSRIEGVDWECQGQYLPGGCNKYFRRFPNKLNRAGAHMALGIQNNYYYCGRRLKGYSTPNSDGWCGPDYGPQCADCKGFDARFRSEETWFDLCDDCVPARLDASFVGRSDPNTCKDNKLRIIEGLIRLGVDINDCDHSGCSPIYVACCEGNLDMVRCLHEKGADVGKRNAIFQWSPFMAACYHGHLDIVRFLHALDIAPKASSLISPATTTIKRNRAGELMALGEGTGANMYYCRKLLVGSNPPGLCGPLSGPQCAACLGFAQSSDPIGINQVDALGFTPLSRSCQGGHLDVVRFLVANDSDLQKASADGMTPFAVACLFSGRVEIVKFLHQEMANYTWFDLNVNNSEGKTPLHLASSRGHAAVARFLLERGADFNQLTNATKQRKDELEVKLEKKKKDEWDFDKTVAVKTTEGWTAFDFARQHGDEKIVNIFKDFGGNKSGQQSNKLPKAAIEKCILCIVAPFLCPAMPVFGPVVFFTSSYREFQHCREYGIPGFCIDCLLDTRSCLSCCLIGSPGYGSSGHMGVDARNKAVFAFLGFVVSTLMTSYCLDAPCSWCQLVYPATPFMACAIAWTFAPCCCCIHPTGPGYVYGTDLLLGLRLCIFNSPNVNGKDADGNTLSHKIVQSGSENALSIVAYFNADCNIKNKVGELPVHIAAREKKYSKVEILVGMGCDLMDANEDGLTGIGLVTSEEFQKEILRKVNKDKIPLYYACKFNMEDRVLELITQDVDFNQSVKESCASAPRSAIEVASLKGNRRIVGLLVESGKVTNFGDALHHACRANDGEMISLLLEGGADLNYRSLENNKMAFDCFIDRSSRVQCLLGREFSLSALKKNDNAFWFHLIQDSDMIGVNDRLLFYVNKYPHLINSKDFMGRISLEMATTSSKRILKAVTSIHGRYTLEDAQALHSSATCLVYRAIDDKNLDSNGNGAKMVALKVMKVKSQYVREVSARLSGKFDPEYLIGMSAFHPSITDCAKRPEVVVDFDTSVIGDVNQTLTKADAERMFCFSMPLGDRNLYLALKSERWVGRNALRVAQVFLQILDCVAHVHSKGWIHGDIKPLNLVRVQGDWKLIDLDASCRIGEDFVGAKSSTAYCPPEFIRIVEGTSQVVLRSAEAFKALNIVDQELLLADPSFDVWSLGCILYQLMHPQVFPLFQCGQDDNLRENSADGDTLFALCSWTNQLKGAKLGAIEEPLCRNLLSLMLSKDPSIYNRQDSYETRRRSS